MSALELRAGDGPALVVLAAVAILYIAYYYGAGWTRLVRRYGREDDLEAQAKAVVAQRWWGGAILGGGMLALALLALPGRPSDYGLGRADVGGSLAFIAFVLAVVFPLVYRQQHQPASWAAYPQVRARRWDRRRFWSNTASWFGYLLGYELLFRGVFLFAMVRWVGPAGAVAITTVVYTLVHLPKPAPETIGSLVMGVIFASVTLWTGGFWAAFVGHALIASWSDYWAVRANPDFEWAP